ncbi:MAG: iron-sulfur cluster assembly scaffold protein [Aigarchaeota archaeon]|nr:iron-sulfur cluster assembly scaffold protein [Aigarchaeota archaeon]MCX8192736.1 iron-sulfur cluster assembly scaffold protein [Nitrososphaeria archaeon]MDW7985988.1 iron-sulfur cluster assembly scaffold protein [Nitrososphaerota archaeon]
MSTRTPLIYSPKVLEIFRNPKNLGAMQDASVVSQAGSPACGDVIRIYLKIEDGKILDASFESYGCAANIAAASILTEMVKGKTLKEAWMISWEEVAEELGGLPAIKYHCSILAVGGLKRAIRKYIDETRRERPDWLPVDLSKEERQALEEEELIEKMYKKHGRAP